MYLPSEPHLNSGVRRRIHRAPDHGKVESFGGRMYAYGFEDGRKDGSGAVGHGGGAPGMNGELRIYPKTGYVVAVLSNLDAPAATQMSAFLDLRLPR